MSNICTLKVYMTREQYDFVKKEAEMSGRSISAFIKEKAMKQNNPVEKMIYEIHRQVVQDVK